MFSRSIGSGICGVYFNIAPNGFGITAYNNTGGQSNPGDVVYMTYHGVKGQQVKANIPAAASTPKVKIGVCLEACNAQEIGKYQLVGDAQIRTKTTAIAIGDHLECIAGSATFDGTATNLAFVAGSGSTRDTITDSDSGLVTDGFVAGQKIVIAGATTSGNDGTHEIYSVAAGVITLTTIGVVTSEAGASGMTMASQGFAQEDATSRSANSFAVSYVADTSGIVELINCYMYGGFIQNVTLAAS